jgi:hypothetical protein
MQKLDINITSVFGEPSCGVWVSDEFAIAAFQDQNAIRLDICRHDLRDGLTWDMLMEIKNQCGFADYDGMEFYPKEKDIINTGNVRHLYLFKENLPLIRRG